MNPPIHRQSFRPYLTFQEIEATLECLAASGLKTQAVITAYSKLFKLKNDAEIGLKLSAYTKAPSLEEKLGMIDSPASTIVEGESLLQRWNSGEILSVEQIARAMEFKFSSGQMSPQEEMDFLSKKGS